MPDFDVSIEDRIGKSSRSAYEDWVDKRVILREGEVVECFLIREDGAVTIWTTNNVWYIHQQGSIEKLLYLPRNPP